MAYAEEQEKRDVCLNLSINSQKSNIFVADLTPTPTRLIKNCDEIGLFDDILRHDNPFDETFRRACEKNYDDSTNTRQADNVEQPAEELHTPQVFPQLETASSSYTNCMPSCHQQDSITTANCVMLDVPACLPCANENFNEKVVVENREDTICNEPMSLLSDGIENAHSTQQPGKSVQLIQPQVITWKIANPEPVTAVDNTSKERSNKKPIKKVSPKAAKSYILPKPSSSTQSSTFKINTHIATQHEPSSASLTPTSQLPIKERLKAILSSSSKARSFESTKPQGNHKANYSVKHDTNNQDDTLERKRAASSRYRSKMRNEQQKLKHENTELKATNKKLRERIASLEKEVEKQRNTIQRLQSMKDIAALDSCQLKIPPSSVNLVINVPGMIVPVNNQPPQLQNPLTYRIEKR